MPLYHVAPTRQLPHTIDLIQRQSAPRFANEIERDQQYPDPEVGALCVVNTNVQVFNGTGWIPVGGGQPTHINNLQDVDARFPPDGAVLTWSSAAQAWGWSMPATPDPATCIPDYFDRADGPLGPNWNTGPPPGWSTDVTPIVIASGAAVGSATGGTDVANAASWATPFSPGETQSIEILVEGITASGTSQYCLLYANATLGSKVMEAVDFEFGTPGTIVVKFFRFDAAGDWVNLLPLPGSVSFPCPPEPLRIRYQSDSDGTQRVFLNGVLLVDVVDPTPCVGTLVGMSLDVPADRPLSPRILETCVG